MGGKGGTFVLGSGRHSLATPQSTVVQTTPPSTPVSRLIAKRNANTDHVWATEDGLHN